MTARSRLIALAVVFAAVAALPATRSYARGGGPANIINSEGYQRALREERKQYAQPQPVAPVTVPRHRHHRHHH